MRYAVSYGKKPSFGAQQPSWVSFRAVRILNRQSGSDGPQLGEFLLSLRSEAEPVGSRASLPDCRNPQRHSRKSQDGCFARAAFSRGIRPGLPRVACRIPTERRGRSGRTVGAPEGRINMWSSGCGQGRAGTAIENPGRHGSASRGAMPRRVWKPRTAAYL